jgi:uncharacterized membrane protein
LIAAHATAAATSLLLGGYQLGRRVKGDQIHRRLGWIWVAAMTFVATSSFAIRELRHGQLSLLHVLSVVTLVSLILAIVQIRRGNVVGHRAAMRGSWIGLVAAFIGAVSVPDRRIPTFAVTSPIGALAAAVAVIAATAFAIAAAHLVDRRPPAPARGNSSFARDHLPAEGVRPAHGCGAAPDGTNARQRSSQSARLSGPLSRLQ